MVIQIRMPTKQWEVRRVWPFRAYQLMYVESGKKTWIGTFRDMEYLDLFISAFEPQAGHGVTPDLTGNPYTRRAIADFMAGTIGEEEFIQEMQVYGALPAQIDAVLADKAEGS